MSESPSAAGAAAAEVTAFGALLAPAAFACCGAGTKDMHLRALLFFLSCRLRRGAEFYVLLLFSTDIHGGERVQRRPQESSTERTKDGRSRLVIGIGTGGQKRVTLTVGHVEIYVFSVPYNRAVILRFVSFACGCQ